MSDEKRQSFREKRNKTAAEKKKNFKYDSDERKQDAQRKDGKDDGSLPRLDCQASTWRKEEFETEMRCIMNEVEKGL